MLFWLVSFAGCGIDKTGSESSATQGATTSGEVASAAASTDGETSTGGVGTTAVGTTDGTWPPVQCGDSLCAEGDVCVVDQTWFCCAYHAAASTTGGSGTSSGGEATTGEPCEDYLAYSYMCEPVPPKCQGNPASLEDCLLGRYCPSRLNPDSFHDGIVDCGAPNHGCYP